MAEAFVLDRELILERLGGDEEILSMMCGVYLEHVEDNCAALARAHAAGDAPALQREAHTVKGLLATFGDDPGAADALLVERSARQGEIAGLGDKVVALQERLREVAGVLRALAGNAG